MLQIIVVSEWKCKLMIYIRLLRLLIWGAVASDAENKNNDQKDYSSNRCSNNDPQKALGNSALSVIHFIALKTEFANWSLKTHRASRWAFPADVSWSLVIAHCWDTPRTCIIHWQHPVVTLTVATQAVSSHIAGVAVVGAGVAAWGWGIEHVPWKACWALSWGSACRAS